jgi:hypothetical protein
VSIGYETERLCWRCRLRRLVNTMRYRCLRLVQVPFGWAFWAIEKAKSRLQDRRDNGEW